jgi:hypothetical protein
MPSGSDPASRLQSVTLSDTTVYDGVRGFHVGGDGTLVVEPAEPWDGATAPGGTVSLAVKGGSFYPYRVRRFLSTGSTASATLLIVALR